MAVNYTPTVFVNGDDPSYIPGSSPGVGATELNKIGNGIKGCADAINAVEVDVSTLQGDVSNLQSNKANKAKEYTGTLDKDDWTGSGPYEQTVSVSGMTSGAMKGGFGLPESATLEQVEAAGAAMIRIKSRSSGSVTFEAKEVPAIDIPFVILEVG